MRVARPSLHTDCRTDSPSNVQCYYLAETELPHRYNSYRILRVQIDYYSQIPKSSTVHACKIVGGHNSSMCYSQIPVHTGWLMGEVHCVQCYISCCASDLDELDLKVLRKFHLYSKGSWKITSLSVWCHNHDINCMGLSDGKRPQGCDVADN